jgi:hypothetical protein
MAERQLVSISRIESRSPIPMASLIRHTDWTIPGPICVLPYSNKKRIPIN